MLARVAPGRQGLDCTKVAVNDSEDDCTCSTLELGQERVAQRAVVLGVLEAVLHAEIGRNDERQEDEAEDGCEAAAKGTTARASE